MEARELRNEMLKVAGGLILVALAWNLVTALR